MKVKTSTYGNKVENYHKNVFLKAIPYILDYCKRTGKRKLLCLDIGCGVGEPLIYFNSLLRKYGISAELFGVDKIQGGAISDKKIKFVKVDINFESLPFSDTSFDLAIATELIEHLYNPENLLKQIFRVLKPRAIMILTTPNLRWWINVALLIAGYNPFIPDTGYDSNYGMFSPTVVHGHIRAYTVYALEEMLNRYGFNIIRIVGSEHPYDVRLKSWGHFFKFIDKTIAKLFPSLAYDIGIIAEKGYRLSS